MTNTTIAAPYPQTFNTFRAVGALRSFRPGIDMDGGDLEPPRHLQREPRDVVAAGRLHRGRQQRRQACCRRRGDVAPLGHPPGADPHWHIGAVGGGHIIRALTAHRLVLKGVAPSLMAWRAARSWHAGSIDDGIGWPPAAGHPVSASIAASVAFRALWSTRMKPCEARCTSRTVTMTRTRRPAKV